ncbi:MAG: Gfo/Idh/MocA family oxidoreductase, partial [Thermoflexales bacterium]|nr:Gfo/Idh/MocA family oxidoreductase [Thermoflexales bacterium]
MSLRERLRAYEAQHGVIKVGLVGAGQMGAGMMSQMERMDGMRVVAVADVMPGRAEAAYAEASVTAPLVVTDDAETAADAIAGGRRAAMRDADALTRIPNLDIIVECTGVPEVGARVCAAAIEARKHIVNMNVETDAT